MKNKLYDCVTRWILEQVNSEMESDYLRRVSPMISCPTLISHSGSLKMGNMLDYASRLNRRICSILEQT